MTLRDRSRVVLRPVRPSDKQLLRDGFDQLSAESRYRRFFAPLKRLSDAQLAYLTEVDHVDHEALIALGADHGEPVGVARYIRLPERPETAEVAVAVVDHWQGRGVATEMLHRLVKRAEAAGIARFTASCLVDNHEVIDLIERLGVSRTAHQGSGVIEIEVELPPAQDHAHPARELLRSAGSGALGFRAGERQLPP